MNYLTQWSIKTISLTIVLSLAEMILPENTVKKYAKLAMNLILVAYILSPVSAIISTDGRFFDGLKEEFYISGETMDVPPVETADINERIIEMYKKDLIEYISRTAEECGVIPNAVEVSVEEDPGSESFGKPIDIYIEIAETNVDSGIVNKIRNRLNNELMPDGVHISIGVELCRTR